MADRHSGTDRHGGNTNTPCKTRKRYWFITVNNPTEEIKKKIREIANAKNDYVFQVEKGEQGTVHIQGVLLYKHPQRFSSIKKLLPTAHIEPVISLKDAIDYCTKEETRVSAPESSKDVDVLKNGTVAHGTNSKKNFNDGKFIKWDEYIERYKLSDEWAEDIKKMASMIDFDLI